MWAVVVFSGNAVLSSSCTVPTALLERDLESYTVAVNEGIQVAVLGILTVVLAAVGLRCWTLVTASTWAADSLARSGQQPRYGRFSATSPRLESPMTPEKQSQLRRR